MQKDIKKRNQGATCHEGRCEVTTQTRQKQIANSPREQINKGEKILTKSMRHLDSPAVAGSTWRPRVTDTLVGHARQACSCPLDGPTTSPAITAVGQDAQSPLTFISPQRQLQFSITGTGTHTLWPWSITSCHRVYMEAEANHKGLSQRRV